MSLLLPVLWAPHHILRGRSDNLGHVQRREARMVGRCKTLSHRDCSRMGLFVGAGGGAQRAKGHDVSSCFIFF